MSHISRPVARCCQCAFQSSSRTPMKISSRASISTASNTRSPVPQRRRAESARRWQSTEASSPASSNPKISTIVDQIGQLTLLETADLVSTLKTRLNIPDLPVGGFAAPPPGAPGAQAAPAEEEDEPAPKEQEKTLFNLTLKSLDAAAKPKVIKEIKQLLNLSLVESKKFVESVPKQMRENVGKEDAEKIIETMKGVGAVVVME